MARTDNDGTWDMNIECDHVIEAWRPVLFEKK